MPRPSAQISPAHPLIREYQRSLGALRGQGVENELGLRRPFENLLADSARLHGWRLVAEWGAKAGGHRIRPDGTVFDANSLPRGYWESKDSHDDLDREIDPQYIVRLVGQVVAEVIQLPGDQAAALKAGSRSAGPQSTVHRDAAGFHHG
jgi:hypothetical protein